MLNLVNLTPHTINVIGQDGKKLDILPSGTVARCSQEEKVIGEINGFPVTQQRFGDVVDLPEPQDGTMFIVSRLVADASRRKDLLIPGPLMRNEEGVVIGCKGFSVL